jgi:hypothetical protein
MDKKREGRMMRARRPASGSRIPLAGDENRGEVGYCMSDVWLLASIEFTCDKGGMDIRDIIAVGDYLNHAIFTEREFEEGLCRLSMGGWITQKGGRFKVSKKFKDRKICYTSPKGRHSTRKLWDQVERLLCGEQGCGKGFPRGNLQYPGNISEKFRKALKEYLEQNTIS